MKKAIVILVIVVAVFLSYRAYVQNQRRQRIARAAVEAERARERNERERADKERAERERETRELDERERADKESARVSVARTRREETEQRLRVEREKAVREEAERAALREKEAAKKRFIDENVAYFTDTKPVFVAKAPAEDRFWAVPERTTFRVFMLIEGNKLRIYELTLQNGKFVEGVERHFDREPTPLTDAGFKKLVKNAAWISRREGSDTAVFHSPRSGRGKILLEGGILDVGKADLGTLAKLPIATGKGHELSYALSLDLKPYGRLALGKIGCRGTLTASETGERIRKAIHARLLDEQKKRDSRMNIVFTDGPVIVRNGRTIEVPRRFLRDNLKDIRAGRVGRATDWKLVRETRRKNRQEWLDLYEEAERRERGIEKPYEIIVPEGDVSRGLQGVFTYAPAD